MLRMWFNQYKWALYIGLLLAYTAGIWHVASGYQENAYNEERLALLQEQQRIESENNLLSHDLAAALLANEATATKQASVVNKGIKDEAVKHPNFNAPIPDSVRDKLNSTRNTGRSTTP